jgi:hypothetical protein
VNVYTYGFSTECIKNSDLIHYTLEIKTSNVIIAEDLMEFPVPDKALHEDLADRYFERFGGRQKMNATHGKVAIETRRGP